MKKVELKFEKGDKVWTIMDNRAVQCTVRTGLVSVGEICEVEYYLEKPGDILASYDRVKECDLYVSREELINSL